MTPSRSVRGSPPLPDPSGTALILMELQRGVVGDLARIPELGRAVASSGLLETTRTLVTAARRAGVKIVHCHAAFPADADERAALPRNIPMLERLLDDPSYLTVGSDQAASAPEVAPEAGDRMFVRHHGMSPFTGTELHEALRSLEVEAVVAAGVSLNVGIPGLTIEAVGLGYRVAIPTDCVVGVPAEYGEDVLRHSLRPLATLTTASDLAAHWTRR